MAFDFYKAPATAEDAYEWCDWIEIFCLVNQENRITREDILDRILNQSNRYTKEQRLRNSASMSIKDDWEIRVSDYFNHIDYRIGAFADDYPFYLDQYGALCLCDNITVRQKTYLFLLASFNRRNFDQSDGTALSTSFEILSLEVLKAMLPSKADVFIYGTSAIGSSARFTGNPYNRFCQLINSLCEKLNPNLRERDFPSKGGDSGLDLVGVVPFVDSAGGRIIVLGQCACSPEEWEKKQFSVSLQLWQNRVAFSVPPVAMTFIPGCYRDTEGQWYSYLSIGSIVIDRLRLLELLDEPETVITSLPAARILEAFIAYREEAV